MNKGEIFVFSASPIRFVLTFVGTICILAIVLSILNVKLLGILIILSFVVVSYAWQNHALTKITISPVTVELEFSSWIIRKSTKCFNRVDLVSDYREKAGPKGIMIMTLTLSQLSLHAEIAEIQPDLTGWKESDLLTVDELLKKHNAIIPTAT